MRAPEKVPASPKPETEPHMAHPPSAHCLGSRRCNSVLFSFGAWEAYADGASSRFSDYRSMRQRLLEHTCHILPPSEIDLGLCLAVVAGSGGKYVFHRIGNKGRIWQLCRSGVGAPMMMMRWVDLRMTWRSLSWSYCY